MAQMPMMDWTTGSSTEWALMIVVTILGLISIYLCYLILGELREMGSVFERVEKLLKSVE